MEDSDLPLKLEVPDLTDNNAAIVPFKALLQTNNICQFQEQFQSLQRGLWPCTTQNILDDLLRANTFQQSSYGVKIASPLHASFLFRGNNLNSMHINLPCGERNERRCGIGESMKRGKTPQLLVVHQATRTNITYFTSLSKYLVAIGVMPPATARCMRKKAMIFC